MDCSCCIQTVEKRQLIFADRHYRVAAIVAVEVGRFDLFKHTSMKSDVQFEIANPVFS